MVQKIQFLLIFSFAIAHFSFSQTKIDGFVVDSKNKPVPFASIGFKNSTEGTVANEDGHFYIESAKTYTSVSISFDGYSDREITLTKAVNYNFKVVLKETQTLKSCGFWMIRIFSNEILNEFFTICVI